MAHVVDLKESSTDKGSLSCCSTSAAEDFAKRKPPKMAVFSDTLVQYQPLIAIFAVSVVGGMLALSRDGWMAGMQMAMGLFLLPLALLKMFNVRGFAKSFALYDPIAGVAPVYGFVYPFLEALLGLLFITGVGVSFAAALAIPLLGVTAAGIAKALSEGRSLQCGCVGETVQLPLGRISLIENVSMTAMAAYMLVA